MLSEDTVLVHKLQHVLNQELIKRSLIRYFTEKGCDNFKRPVYAPMVQDLPLRIPELINKLEIVPYAKEINPVNGQVTVGWNLFVLGNNRMSLGESTHNNMSELQRAINGPMIDSITMDNRSPEDIIDFVIKVLSNSKSGMLKPQTTQQFQPSLHQSVNRPKVGSTLSGGYYEKRRPY